VQQISTDPRGYFASCLAFDVQGRRSANTEPLPGSLVTSRQPIMRASLRERARPAHHSSEEASDRVLLQMGRAA